LSQAWKTGGVERIVVLHVPSERVYALEYSPERLDQDAIFSFAVRGPQEHEVCRELLAEVEKLEVERSAMQPPLSHARQNAGKRMGKHSRFLLSLGRQAQGARRTARGPMG